MKKVAILTYPHTALFELGCASELFALPRPELKNWYQTDIVTFGKGPYPTVCGLQLLAKSVVSLKAYSMLVVPSWPCDGGEVVGPIADEIRQFHADGKRIISFCSGAFLLASLGILSNKKATTHWRYAEQFKQQYNDINYISNVLYVFDGKLGCSAGSAAAIDLGLEVIRYDYGQTIANHVARRLVVSAHRKGGQSQFVESPMLKSPNQMSAAIDWAYKHLSQAFTIDQLAQQANMSRRSFDRKFRQSYNQTPKDWLTQQRLDLAKELLEGGTANIEQIADSTGFNNATTLRHNFRKHLGLSPRQYRDQFAG